MIYATPSKILWSMVLLCVILLFMGCSGKWVDTEDLVGLDEGIQRAIRTPSRVPLAIVWSDKIRKQFAPGYKFKSLRGHLKQLPDGKRCWYDEKQIEFQIRHKQQKLPKLVIGTHELLLRLSNEGTKDYKIHINGENCYPNKNGEWHIISPFTRNTHRSIDAYFPAISTVSIQSEQGVCLSSIILVDHGIMIK